ncbi:UNVERIFIED_CONTAM: hypothetical protein FKN15_007129 [Acipenser sinensis]
MGLGTLWILSFITGAAHCLSAPAQGVESVVRSRVGGSAVLGCNLTPPSAPPPFPLHVIEWVRLGWAVPVFIKFGLYSPRVHPNYQAPAQGVESVVRSRVGGSAVLGCNLTPPSVPPPFPLHVIEWVRLGWAVPVFIKFGLYSPRVHPNYQDLTHAFQKDPSPPAGPFIDSTDSVMKLRPLLYDHSPSDKARKSHHQQRQLLLANPLASPRYAVFESYLGSSAPPTSPIESISRGPDGRFIVQPCPECITPACVKNSLKKHFPQGPNGLASLEREKSGRTRHSSKSHSCFTNEEERSVGKGPKKEHICCYVTETEDAEEWSKSSGCFYTNEQEDFRKSPSLFYASEDKKLSEDWSESQRGLYVSMNKTEDGESATSNSVLYEKEKDPTERSLSESSASDFRNITEIKLGTAFPKSHRQFYGNDNDKLDIDVQKRSAYFYASEKANGKEGGGTIEPSLESTGELTTSIPQEPGYLENKAASQKRDGIFLEQTSSDLQNQNRFTCETSQWPSHFQGHPGTFQIRPSGFEASNTGQPTSQGPETESSLVRPPEAKRLPFRTYLPRGYSWPSPYHNSLQLRESVGEAESETERQGEREAEIEIKDVRDVKEARASFASQSSGRGSVGPTFAPSLHRYSLSLTPSLPASPETTQNEAESETRAEETARSVPPHLGSRAKKRRDTSVDESYEWDSVDFPVESEILEALKLYSKESETAGEQKRERPRSTIAVRELESRGLLSPDPPVSPASSQYRLPVRSLSEARFNELRQEFLEYRREQESSRDKKPDSEATLL